MPRGAYSMAVNTAPFRSPPRASSAQEVAEGQKDRGEDPDLVVGREQAGRDGAAAHREQADHQSLLVAEAVTEVTEHDGAQQADHEGNAEGRERRKRIGDRTERREEERPEHQHRGCAEDEEVEELEGCTNEAGAGDTADRHLGHVGHSHGEPFSRRDHLPGVTASRTSADQR
ncbi:hypothetical protein ABT300_22825 [Streptomyces sp. NPDC001027]|uniref:hypothetical protein n=1 Tax=Streptomyces sp. NPDC001027 TaxID=3154771 RepID=UPI00331E8A96